MLDKGGRIRMFNRAMEQILGWTRFHVDGQAWANACTPPDEHDEARRWINDALRGALRSYEAIGLTNSGGRISFRFEFSLVGRGSRQGLMMTATHAVPAQGLVGPLEGQDLDYEVTSTPAKFGEVTRIAANGEWIRLSQPEVRCFAVIYGIQQPCENCPMLSDSESPWPRISVRHRAPSGTMPRMFEIKTADKLGDEQVRVRLRLLPDQAVDAIQAAKVDQLSAGADLSPREREILSYLLLGRNVDDIAQVVGIAVRTVKYHQANVLAKLGAESRADLMRLLF